MSETNSGSCNEDANVQHMLSHYVQHVKKECDTVCSDNLFGPGNKLKRHLVVFSMLLYPW